MNSVSQNKEEDLILFLINTKVKSIIVGYIQNKTLGVLLLLQVQMTQMLLFPYSVTSQENH